MAKITKDLPVMSKVLLTELRECVDQEDVEKLLRLSSRAEIIGFLGQMLCRAIEKSAIYWMNGTGRIFDGKMYVEFTRDDMYVAIRNFVMTPSYGLSPSISRNGSIQDVCQMVMITVHTRLLNPDHNLVSMRNGVLDLTTLQLRKHNKNLTPFCYLDFDYDPEAECPRWIDFLEQVLPPEIGTHGNYFRDKQDIIQEFIGCPLIDRKTAKIEKMMILFGSGSNGKSVVAHVITSIYGSENCTHFSFDELLSSGDVAKNTAKINGKLINVAEEIQAVNCSKYGDRLKVLISGEPVNARSMWGDPFVADEIPLLMANANKLPKLDDASHGLQRRMIIIPFDVIIPSNKQDLTLPSKLDEEKSGIFNWILEGRERFIQGGYKFSAEEAISKRSDEFMAKNNTVLGFMMDTDRHSTYSDAANSIGSRCRIRDLYTEYTEWCVNRHVRIDSFGEFSNALDSAGYQKKRYNNGIMIVCYGESLKNSKERIAKQVEKSLSKSMSCNSPFRLPDGRIVTLGNFNAARFMQVSSSWLGMMQMSRRLDDAILNGDEKKKYGIKTKSVIYDLMALQSIVDKLYQRSPEKMEKVLIKDQEARDFNKAMREINMPFRKMVGGMLKTDLYITNRDSMIMVDIDWQYSEDNARAKMIEYEQEKSK